MLKFLITVLGVAAFLLLSSVIYAIADCIGNRLFDVETLFKSLKSSAAKRKVNKS